MCLADGLYERYRGDLRDGWRHTDAHPPQQGFGALGGDLTNGIQPRENFPRRREHAVAELGQDHATAMADEERRPQLRFDQADLSAQRRLDDTQSLGGAAEA